MHGFQHSESPFIQVLYCAHVEVLYRCFESFHVGSEKVTSFKTLFSEHLVTRLWGQCAPNGILECAFPERSQTPVYKEGLVWEASVWAYFSPAEGLRTLHYLSLELSGAG